MKIRMLAPVLFLLASIAVAQGQTYDKNEKCLDDGFCWEPCSPGWLYTLGPPEQCYDPADPPEGANPPPQSTSTTTTTDTTTTTTTTDTGSGGTQLPPIVVPELYQPQPSNITQQRDEYGIYVEAGGGTRFYPPQDYVDRPLPDKYKVQAVGVTN